MPTYTYSPSLIQSDRTVGRSDHCFVDERFLAGWRWAMPTLLAAFLVNLQT